MPGQAKSQTKKCQEVVELQEKWMTHAVELYCAVQATKAWKRECDLTKSEQWQPEWPKPKQGALEKPIPRPKKPENVESSSEDKEGGDNMEMENHD